MNNTLASEKKPARVWKTIFTIVLIFAATFLALKQDSSKLKTFVAGFGPYGFLICIFLYTLLGASLVPSEPVTLLLTSLYGPLVTILLATIGNTLASLVEYFIGGQINDLANFEKKRQSLPFNLGKMPVNSPVFLLVGRMIPAIGPKSISIVGGIYKVPLWTYIWTAIVSNLIGAVTVAMGSYGLLHLL